MLNSKHNMSFGTIFPFWLSLALIPLIWIAAIWGGWSFLIVILASWFLFSALDAVLGLNLENADPEEDGALIFWYKILTVIWAPFQFITLFGVIWYCTHSGLSELEKFGLFFSVGVITGTIGINYSHELMHQSNRKERAMADILLSMVLYSHFRSEHLLVHHTFIGTPRDAVTARYGEGFYRFFLRIIKECWLSGFRAEKAKLARKNLPWYDGKNPFLLYVVLQLGMVLLAFSLGGWSGLALFSWQAIVAICSLEIINYIEHYGLTRKHFGNGKYEHIKPHHSWNSAHTATNWLLINLQRHSDHHFKPNRRFPLLQNYSSADAPQLPFGYPVMSAIALFPSVWRKTMNPKVRKWREMYYPEIQDWSKYNKASNPAPRGA
jgi:alkane 1-monooxygenase